MGVKQPAASLAAEALDADILSRFAGLNPLRRNAPRFKSLGQACFLWTQSMDYDLARCAEEREALADDWSW